MLIQPITNLFPELNTEFSIHLELSEDIIFCITKSLFSSPPDLRSLSQVNRQFNLVIEGTHFQRTDALRKLISVTNRIFKITSNIDLTNRQYLLNDQFIACIEAKSLKLLDTSQEKIYSFNHPYDMSSKKCQIFNQKLAVFEEGYIDIFGQVEKESKINFFTLEQNSTLAISHSFSIPARKNLSQIMFTSVDSSGIFAIAANPFTSFEPSHRFIDIVNIENQTIHSIEDQEVLQNQLQSKCMTIDQDVLYIGYKNWSAPNPLSYNNSDCVKSYSLLTREVLATYACSCPRKIVIADKQIIISKDLVFIQILDKHEGSLLHEIDPTQDRLDQHSLCGYIQSLLRYQNTLIVGLRDNRIKFFSIETGELLHIVNLNTKPYEEAVFYYNMEKIAIHDRYIAIIQSARYKDSDNDKILIFDMKNFRFVYAFDTVGSTVDLKFSEKKLIVTLKNGQIQAWDSKWENEIEALIQDPIVTDEPENLNPPEAMPTPILRNELLIQQFANNPERIPAFIQIRPNWSQKLALIIKTVSNLFIRFINWLIGRI